MKDVSSTGVPLGRATARVTVVSGLPRSGTSMMMRMLDAGGIAPLTDAVRQADDDNPRGYFELERVKSLAETSDWLNEAAGKAIKIVSPLLDHLPGTPDFDVIFLRRALPEVLASQRAMLVRRGKPADASDDPRMQALFEKHLAKIESALAARPNVRCLYVSHREAVEDPARVAGLVADFLGRELDRAAMAAAVDRSLYRQKG